jgi:hypothetical protein
MAASASRLHRHRRRPQMEPEFHEGGRGQQRVFHPDQSGRADRVARLRSARHDQHAAYDGCGRGRGRRGR